MDNFQNNAIRSILANTGFKLKICNPILHQAGKHECYEIAAMYKTDMVAKFKFIH